PVGDARGTTRTLNREAVYDYQYAAASRTYGATVWMDVRNAAVCPAVDAYRQSLIDGNPIPKPSPLTDCPPMFGNEDIYSGSFLGGTAPIGGSLRLQVTPGAPSAMSPSQPER